MDSNQASFLLIGCALEVHKNLGPGLLESVYEACLVKELNRAGLECKTQVPIPITYKNEQLDVFYRADMIVENVLLVELKSIDKVARLHRNQVVTYLKLGGWNLGLLINFNTTLLKSGIHRIILN